MEVNEKQTLLLNFMEFAKSKLPEETFKKIKLSKLEYNVSGESLLLQYRDKELNIMIDSIIYSDNSTNVIIFDGEKVYSKN